MIEEESERKREKMGVEGESKCVRQMGILSGGDAVVRVFGSAWSVPLAQTSTYHIPTPLLFPLYFWILVPN